MKVGIVGIGNVGGALARNLVRNGVEVLIASRKPDEAKAEAEKLGAKAKAVLLAELGPSAELLMLATPANGTEAALESVGNIDGKIIVDCSNPLTWQDGPVSAAPAEGSQAARLQARFPKARVVKAFNTFGAEFHERPELGTTRADLYYAGDDAAAKAAVAELAKKMGFEPIDVGPMRNARHLESLAILWIHLALVGGKGREVAFKLLGR
jgi:NADPH-dependent F420 reductase